MVDELESIKDNETWTIVNLPPVRKTIDTKWVYKIKRDADGCAVQGTVGCARFQPTIRDRLRVFAPLVRQATFRTLMAVVAKKRMTVKQYDIKTAFLYGDLEEEIFMRQPCGFEIAKGKVCKLKKSLYGLKQAARSWNQKLHDALKRQGFDRYGSTLQR